MGDGQGFNIIHFSLLDFLKPLSLVALVPGPGSLFNLAVRKSPALGQRQSNFPALKKIDDFQSHFRIEDIVCCGNKGNELPNVETMTVGDLWLVLFFLFFLDPLFPNRKRTF